jgi:hypothetical protein
MYNIDLNAHRKISTTCFLLQEAKTERLGTIDCAQFRIRLLIDAKIDQYQTVFGEYVRIDVPQILVLSKARGIT